jgi:hypothetical protein
MPVSAVVSDENAQPVSFGRTPMTTDLSKPRFSPRDASMLWIALLTAASTITTLALACATPFPALAALAAVHMKRRDGIMLMMISWGASQLVGFGVHHYPHDPKTIAWAIALATAAVVSIVAADALVRRIGTASTFVKLALAFVVASVTFKLTVLLWSFGLGGIETALSPTIFARQFVRNGEILIGLFALYYVLLALGVPAARRERAMA